MKPKKLKHYSGDFKISAIEEVLISHMGQRETARKYGVTHKMIQTWIKLYLEKGKDYFYRTNRKNQETLITELPSNSDICPQSKKPRSKKSKMNEKLLPVEVQQELNKLRMENAYLKKLNALVRKKEKSQTKIKLK